MFNESLLITNEQVDFQNYAVIINGLWLFNKTHPFPAYDKTINKIPWVKHSKLHSGVRVEDIKFCRNSLNL